MTTLSCVTGPVEGQGPAMYVGHCTQTSIEILIVEGALACKEDNSFSEGGTDVASGRWVSWQAVDRETTPFLLCMPIILSLCQWLVCKHAVLMLYGFYDIRQGFGNLDFLFCFNVWWVLEDCWYLSNFSSYVIELWFDLHLIQKILILKGIQF